MMGWKYKIRTIVMQGARVLAFFAMTLLFYVDPAIAATPITNLQELQDISLNPGANYYLASDINAAETVDWNGGAGFEPIDGFSGTFDGNGYTIYGLTIHRPTEDKVGIFRSIVNDGHVGDVNLIGVDVTGNNQVGALCGYLFLADVSNISVYDSQVVGSSRVGGLLGESYNGHGITDTFIKDAEVSGISEVGGVVGRSWDGTINTIRRAHVRAAVTASSYMVGGIVGYTKSSDIIESFVEGSVNGALGVGGIAGYTIENAGIHNSSAVNSVVGDQYVGGIAGLFVSYHDGVSNTFFAGTVMGNNYTGAFLGYNQIGAVNSNYYDEQLNAGFNGVGAGSANGITGVTSLDMAKVQTFTGWDFTNSWVMGGDYPILQAFPNFVEVRETPYSPPSVTIRPGDNYISNPSGFPIHIQEARFNRNAIGGFSNQTADVIQFFDGEHSEYRTFFLVTDDEGIDEEFRGKWFDQNSSQVADYTFEPGQGFLYQSRAAESYVWTEYPQTELTASRMTTNLYPTYTLIAHPYAVELDLNETTLSSIAEAGDFIYIVDNGFTRFDWVTGTGDPTLDNKWIREGATEVESVPLAVAQSFYYFNSSQNVKVWTELDPNISQRNIAAIEPGNGNLISNPLDKPIHIQSAAFSAEAIGSADAYLADNITIYNSDTQVVESLYYTGEDPVVPDEFHNTWFNPAEMKPSTVLLQPGETFTYDSKSMLNKVWVEAASSSMPVAVYLPILPGFNTLSNPLSVAINLQNTGIDPVFNTNCSLADRVIVDGQPSFYCQLQGNPLSWSQNFVLNPGEGFSYLHQGGGTYWFEQLLGQSISRVQGNQILLQRRLPDGTLAPEEVYVIKGVNYSPVDRNETVTSYEEHRGHMLTNNDHLDTDFQDMLDMGVNTIRTYVDLSENSNNGYSIDAWMNFMDKAYEHGIMVLMNIRTSDFGALPASTPHPCPSPRNGEVFQVVSQFQRHPALLGWVIGNEWNINQASDNSIVPFFCYDNVVDAAEGVERTISGVPNWWSGIKQMDTNHIVVSTLGFVQDYQMNGGYIDLFTAEDQINFGEFASIFNAAPSVDVWGFNLYRGNSLNTFFAQWRKAFPDKPVMITEFGTDAFDSVAGLVDEQQQANTYQSLWREIYRNLSAHDPANQAVGGFAFEWNDEWWKSGNDPFFVSGLDSENPTSGVSASEHDTGGFALSRSFSDKVRGNGVNNENQVTFLGHPDGWSNEEYYGVTDIDRNPRAVYNTMMQAYTATGVPAESVSFAARSQTGMYDPVTMTTTSPDSYVVFYKNNEPLSLRYATERDDQNQIIPVARGFNLMVIDKDTGTPKALEVFDMWPQATAISECDRFENYVMNPSLVEEGDIIMVAVADTATPINVPYQECRNALTKLGSTQNLDNLGVNQPYILISTAGTVGFNGVQCYEEIGASQNLTIDGGCSSLMLPALP